MKTFREATNQDMLSYAQQTLDWELLNAILIHVGTSNVTMRRKTGLPVDLENLEKPGKWNGDLKWPWNTKISRKNLEKPWFLFFA